jgi:hypothetical protein
MPTLKTRSVVVSPFLANGDNTTIKAKKSSKKRPTDSSSSAAAGEEPHVTTTSCDSSGFSFSKGDGYYHAARGANLRAYRV